MYMYVHTGLVGVDPATELVGAYPAGVHTSFVGVDPATELVGAYPAAAHTSFVGLIGIQQGLGITGVGAPCLRVALLRHPFAGAHLRNSHFLHGVRTEVRTCVCVCVCVAQQGAGPTPVWSQ